MTRYGERERLGLGGGGKGESERGRLGGRQGETMGGGGGVATAAAGGGFDTWLNLTTDTNRLSKKNIHTTVQSVHQLLYCK